ncbi:MAG: LamG domain-containing protein [Magnetospirillum sp.]|nr:LamG domain-containing protein [Magnetospirillum sp.]
MLSDTMMLGGGRQAAYSIENSLLFRGGQYLSRTPSVTGDRQKFTISAWVRRARLDVEQHVFSASNGANSDTTIFGLTFTETGAIAIGGGVTNWRITTALYRDVNAWYHIVCTVDTTTQTVSLEVNGIPVTSFSTNNAIPLNLQTAVNSIVEHRFGALNYAFPYYNNCQIAEPVVLDGVTLTSSSFGEFDPATLNWRPKRPAVVLWGTNGCYLGKPWNNANLGMDYSGRGNHWAPVGFAATDVVADTPTNVYATLNPLDKGAAFTYSNGNLSIVTSSSLEGSYRSSMVLPNSGIWVAEATVTVAHDILGIMPPLAPRWPDISYTAVEIQWGRVWARGTNYYTFSPLSEGSVIGVVANTTAGTAQFYVDGSAFGSAVPLPLSSDIAFGGHDGSPTYFQGADWNFGQKPFAYPNVYGAAKPLCTANMPPTVGIASGSFIGSVSADGPCIYTGAVPRTLTINGNAVTWGTHADKLATGFKIRTDSASYNSSGTNTWTATYDRKPTVGPKGRAPANAQVNP